MTDKSISFGRALVPSCCVELNEHIGRADSALRYEPLTRTLYLSVRGDRAIRAVVTFCPYCGARLPRSLLEEWVGRVAASLMGVASDGADVAQFAKMDWWTSRVATGDGFDYSEIEWPPLLEEVEAAGLRVRRLVEQLLLSARIEDVTIPDSCRRDRIGESVVFCSDRDLDRSQARVHRVLSGVAKDFDSVGIAYVLVLRDSTVLELTIRRRDGSQFFGDRDYPEPLDLSVEEMEVEA